MLKCRFPLKPEKSTPGTYVFSEIVPEEGEAHIAIPTLYIKKPVIDGEALPLTLKFAMDKETKGTIRYSEVVDKDANTSIPTIYIRKTAMGGLIPKKLNVLVKVSKAKEIVIEIKELGK